MKKTLVLIVGLVGILALAGCKDNGKIDDNKPIKQTEAIQDKKVSSPKDDKQIPKEVSIKGVVYEAERGRAKFENKKTFILGKTTFNEIYKSNEYKFDEIEIPNTPKNWKKIENQSNYKLIRMRIPNVGIFQHMFFTFEDNILVEVHLSSPKYLIDMFLLENALNMKYKKLSREKTYAVYTNNNGVTITMGTNDSFAYLHYELDSFTKKKDDLIEKNTQEASKFL